MLHWFNVSLFDIAFFIVALFNVSNVALDYVPLFYCRTSISWSTLFMVHHLMLHYFNVSLSDVALFWYWII